MAGTYPQFALNFANFSNKHFAMFYIYYYYYIYYKYVADMNLFWSVAGKCHIFTVAYAIVQFEPHCK